MTQKPPDIQPFCFSVLLVGRQASGLVNVSQHSPEHQHTWRCYMLALTEGDPYLTLTNTLIIAHKQHANTHIRQLLHYERHPLL